MDCYRLSADLTALSDGITENCCAPCPIDLFVLADIAMSGVINDEQVVVSSMFYERGHLYAQLDTGIWNGRYCPFVRVVVVSLAKDLFKGEKVVFGRIVLLPSKQQDRGSFVG